MYILTSQVVGPKGSMWLSKWLCSGRECPFEVWRMPFTGWHDVRGDTHRWTELGRVQEWLHIPGVVSRFPKSAKEVSGKG
jgi:hypothetical protein